MDSYISEHDKKYDYHLIKNDFELVSSKYEHCPHLKCDYLNNTIVFSWQKVLEEVVDDYKDKGYTFDRIDELNIITIADKMDMSYDFYIKHNMHADEWKVISMINKNKTLINKLHRKWNHPLMRKFCHIPFNN